jgi:hypothetical protein
VDHHSIARILLAVFCGIQGAATAVIDLNRTHATHPGWLGHARFHVVWQTATVVALSLIEIFLVSLNGPAVSQRFYFASTLAAAPMLGFFAALFTRKLYAGMLSDPLGMPAWIVRASGEQYKIDLNLVAVSLGVVFLSVIVAIYRAP